jgi:flagellar biogenesis protein FliO
MGGYIANFTVYTMAMIGLICFAVFIYKKVMDGTIRKDNTKFLCVEESMSLSPRKTLHIVRAGNEKFLIASDVDRTTLISKLGEEKTTLKTPERFCEEKPLSDEVKQLEPEVSREIQLDNIFNTKQPQERNQVYFNEVLNQIERPQIVRNRPPRRKDRSVVTLDFNNSKERGLSPMQEMAKKINEL